MLRSELVLCSCQDVPVGVIGECTVSPVGADLLRLSMYKSWAALADMVIFTFSEKISAIHEIIFIHIKIHSITHIKKYTSIKPQV